MQYYILFAEDGESPDNFTPHQTLDDAVKVAKEIVARDVERSSDNYYINGVEPDTFPEISEDYTVFGEEI